MLKKIYLSFKQVDRLWFITWFDIVWTVKSVVRAQFKNLISQKILSRIFLQSGGLTWELIDYVLITLKQNFQIFQPLFSGTEFHVILCNHRDSAISMAVWEGNKSQIHPHL